MHIVMFLDGKEVRISRLAGPTFCATSECSPMTTAPVQACPVLYCTVSDGVKKVTLICPDKSV